REEGAPADALDQGEADDGGIVCNLPIDVGRGERGMAEPAHRDHRFPPDRRRRRARAKVAPRGAALGVLACMLALMDMGNYASLPFSNSANRLDCQTPCDGNFDSQRFSGVVSNHAPSLTLQHIKSSMLFGLYGKAPRVRRNKKTVSGRGSFCRKRIGADFIRGCLGQGANAPPESGP